VPTIKELQTAINEKNLDTRKLNAEQMQALDAAFDSGELTGYDSIQDYDRLINLGAKSVAIGKEQKLEPLKTSTGLERGDLVFAGAASMSMVPYYMNRDQLMKAFVQSGFKDRFGVDMRNAEMFGMYQKRFTALSDAVKKLPTVRGRAGLPVRMLGSLAGMADNTIDFFKKLKRYGATPALSTEAQSSLLAAGGAGAGSILYSIGNLGSDYVGATSQDLANLTDNDIRKLPFAQRALYNGLNEAYNDLLWAGGAMSLIPLVRFAGRETLKQSLGLNSQQSKAIAQSFERMGERPNVAALIPGENAFQNFFKKFFTTIGVYPLVSGPLTKFNKEFNQRLSNEEFLATVDNLNMAPGSNQSIMNYAGINEIKKEWKNVWKTVDTEYGKVRKHWEEIGNPKMIPTATIKQETERLMTQMKNEYPSTYSYSGAFDNMQKGARDLTPADDPLVQYIQFLNDITRNDKYIRMSDWSGLSRMQTAAYTGTKFKNVKPQILVIRNAMEKDLNSMQEATVRTNLKDKIFADEYKNILDSEGPQAAEAFIDKQIRVANSGFNQLKEANAYYSLVLRPFSTNKVARQLSAVDAKIFADKGIEMQGNAGIYPDQVFDKVIRRVLDSDSPDAIRQLKQVLGVTKSSYEVLGKDGQVKRTIQIPKSKESQEIYDRYVRTFFWDSWNEAMTNPLRDHRSLSAQAIAAQAVKKGFINKRIFALDDATEQRVRAKTKLNETIDVTEVDGRVFTQGDSIANLNDGVIRNHNFGEFDTNKFVKNLGLDKPQGKDKIREMFGGGAQGEKALKRIEDIIQMKRALDLVEYTDPSKFVQRSITLRAGSSGGIMAGATSAAFGFGNTLKLILGSRLLGGILTDPKRAENLMEMNKYMRFMTDDPNKIALKPQLAPRIANTFTRFINGVMEAEGDDFRVDPDNIDFEEIRQKLQELDPNIPLTVSYDFGSMPKFTRDRIYPEFEMMKKLPASAQRAGNEFLQGANLMALQEQKFEEMAEGKEMLPQSTQPQNMGVPPTNTQPQAMTPPPTQNTGQQQAQQYATLFPQDTLGQAVATRQFNQGGFVEDIYNQVDEVLNG
jgi:hypothetical protein